MISFNNALLTRWLRILAIVILVVVPFHAFLAVWFSQALGHYTALRLWKELVLVVLVGMAIAYIARDTKLRQLLLGNRLFKKLCILIGCYVLVHLLIGSFALLFGEVSTKAFGYALISNLRFLLFFLGCVCVGVLYKDWIMDNWKRLLLIPASIVIGLGLLQFFVLPADFLQHFGYGKDTIAAYISVDQKPEYARVQSTLRGPNPLGAYLVIVVAALAAICIHDKARRRPYILCVATVIVLFATYSRSAWLGALLTVGALLWLAVGPAYRKYTAIFIGIVVIAATATVIALRNNDLVQNVVFHTDETSQSATSSNENRANAITGSFKDIIREPLGRGPGTAGPASVYNTERVPRISENYFLQIGQEVGLIGLGLFVVINVIVGRLLWLARSQSILPLVLLASLAGLTVVNLLSHAWADDTLAYVWWGFAGLAIGMHMLGSNVKKKKARAKKTI